MKGFQKKVRKVRPTQHRSLEDHTIGLIEVEPEKSAGPDMSLGVKNAVKEKEAVKNLFVYNGC
jgi:hypothetical protein